MEDYRKRLLADIARAFHVPARLLNAGQAMTASEAIAAHDEAAIRTLGIALIHSARHHRKAINRRRYERRFHNHVPRMKTIKVRTEAERARAITRQAIEVRRWATVGVLFRGALDWLRATPDVKEMAVPRGTYHSATKKGPGRRPARPRHQAVTPTRGGKWLPRLPMFPRGY